MNDFITLSCPTCGGKLTVDKDVKAYVCEYCGRQHIIRPEDKEFFAKCPLCQRNDKVDKVTALYSGDGLSTNKLAPPKHPDNLVEYRPNPKPQFTPKPRVIAAPMKSKPSIKSWRLILGLLFIIAFIVMAIIFDRPGLRIFFLFSSILYLTLFIPMAIKRIKENSSIQKKWEEAKKEYDDLQKGLALWSDEQKMTKIEQEKWEDYKTRYDVEFSQKKEKMVSQYNKALERYNRLYYCRRDDCVFFPGEKGYAPASELTNFVYKGIRD